MYLDPRRRMYSGPGAALRLTRCQYIPLCLTKFEAKIVGHWGTCKSAPFGGARSVAQVAALESLSLQIDRDLPSDLNSLQCHFHLFNTIHSRSSLFYQPRYNYQLCPTCRRSKSYGEADSRAKLIHCELLPLEYAEDGF